MRPAPSPVTIAGCMHTLNKYIVSEIVRSLLAVTILLLFVTLGLFLGDTLADVARGTVPADLLLSQLALRSLEATTILIPLAMFLAGLMTLGRLYRDSEMVVLSACGVSRRALLRPLMRLALPLAALLLVLGLWVSPWAQRTAKVQIAEATSKVSVAGLQAGRFQSIAAHDSVVYVESVSRDGSEFTGAFVHIERDGRKDIVTADRGFQYTDPASGAKYLALIDGMRAEGVPGQGDFRIMRFDRNDVRIPEIESSGPGLRRGSMTLAELRAGDAHEDWAEFHWRLAPAIALLSLTLLALPLSYSRPRQGYYGNLLLGILVYVVYANLLALGKGWLEEGKLPQAFGLFWLPALSMVAAWWMLRQDRSRRVRPA